MMIQIHVNFRLFITAMLLVFYSEERSVFSFNGFKLSRRRQHRGPTTNFHSSPFALQKIVSGFSSFSRTLQLPLALEDSSILVDADVIFDDGEAKSVDVVISDATDTNSINVEILKKESFLNDAKQLIESIENGLAAGGVDVPPPELVALKSAVDDISTTSHLLSKRIYELLIEKGMRYDLDPATGRLSPTEFDIKKNLETPAVKNEFRRQYSYGMQAAMTGILDVECVKEIVLDRLIKRTGLAPEEFDKWLGF